MKIKLFLLFTFYFLFISCEKLDETNKPNVIIFIADDISWDDFGCYGNHQVNTPNIDL